MPGERFEATVRVRGTRELIHVTEGSLTLDLAGKPNVVTAESTAIALTDRPHIFHNSGNVPVQFTMALTSPQPAVRSAMCISQLITPTPKALPEGQ